MIDDSLIKIFDTGATRSSDNMKYDVIRFLSSDVLDKFFQYMYKHRKQANGEMRSPDNWKKGISIDSYMDSMGRHFFDVWKLYESGEKTIIRPDGEVVDMEEALTGLMFNVHGMLYETLKKNKDVSSSNKKDNK